MGSAATLMHACHCASFGQRNRVPVFGTQKARFKYVAVHVMETKLIVFCTRKHRANIASRHIDIKCVNSYTLAGQSPYDHLPTLVTDGQSPCHHLLCCPMSVVIELMLGVVEQCCSWSSRCPSSSLRFACIRR